MALSRPLQGEETTELSAPYSQFLSFANFFKKGAEEVFHSLGYFLGQLQTHLTDMEKISSEISTVNNEFANRLWALVKDISSLRDYYHVIYNSTKGVVNYGSSGIIYDIQRRIRDKAYYEATELMDSFLDNLKERIEMVGKIVNKMKQDESVNFTGIENRVKTVKDEYDAAKQLLNEKVSPTQAKQTELWRVGSSSFFYVALGTVTGGMLISCMPDTTIGAMMKQITENVGNEIVTFSFGNTLKGLNSLASNVPYELQKKVGANASKVLSCIDQFFKVLAHFHMQIGTVETVIDEIKCYNTTLQKSLKCKPMSKQNTADWLNISEYLQQVYDSIIYLQQEVVEKEPPKMEGINKAMEDLFTVIDRASKGTPV